MTEPGLEALPARIPARLPPLYIAARTSVVTLKDGSRVLLRPVVATDRVVLAREFERLSPESRYRRFFGPLKVLSESLLDYLTTMDYVNHFAWAALSADPGPFGDPDHEVLAPGSGLAPLAARATAFGTHVRMVSEPREVTYAPCHLEDDVAAREALERFVRRGC